MEDHQSSSSADAADQFSAEAARRDPEAEIRAEMRGLLRGLFISADRIEDLDPDYVVDVVFERLDVLGVPELPGQVEFPPRSKQCLDENVYEWARAHPEIRQFHCIDSDGVMAIDVDAQGIVCDVSEDGSRVRIRFAIDGVHRDHDDAVWIDADQLRRVEQ